MRARNIHELIAGVLWMAVCASYWRHSPIPYSLVRGVANAFPKGVDIDALLDVAFDVPPTDGQEPEAYANMVLEQVAEELNA